MFLFPRHPIFHADIPSSVFKFPAAFLSAVPVRFQSMHNFQGSKDKTFVVAVHTAGNSVIFSPSNSMNSSNLYDAVRK